MFGLGPTEILVIIVLLVVVFGAKKLPTVGRGLGQAMKEFKNATGEEEKTDESSKPIKEDSSAEKTDFLKKLPGLKEYADVKEKVNKVRKITRSL